ncbi:MULTISPECIES: hypothetical protein [Corallococcus]|uniref:hypothetical protein n=1 Tax=Corallococcus TaxID=83461 RepID=UPI001180DC49|nr:MULTISPECIES: hypothetical protein [Corallococcus]NBD09492.1 hypothetical protein [Corallococcus silvisoli]TSC31442.1 hypothetical protein FOF48_12275 [Corallococcus sp. Z5C101001]
MHSVPSRPSAPRALLAMLTFCASVLAACGDPKPPPVPDPPVVSLNVPQPNSATPTLTVRVIVSGCDAVARVDIYDQDTFLKTVPYTSGSMDFELAANEIKYTRGLAVSLSLNARATCADGRTNVSQPASATFLPVTKVVKDPDPNGQVVTDFFITEGTGANISFIGCGNPTTGSGTLFRVDAAGVLRNSVEMGIPCSAATVITPINPSSGKRWVWTPGAGAVAVDANFTITGRTSPTYFLVSLSVMSNGDALVRDRYTVSRLKHTNAGGTFQWTYKGAVLGPIAPPQEKGQQVLVPYVAQLEFSQVPQVIVAYLDANGTSQELQPVQERKIYAYNGQLDAPPVTTFSADGSTIYFAFLFGNNQSRVQACSTDLEGCEGAAFKWASPTLPVPINFLLPYSAGSRIAAIGTQRVWFLDATNGIVTNKGGTSVDASGKLRIVQVQLGQPTSPEFYLLNAPDVAGVLPQEIVAVDASEKGELFRYEVSSSLSCSVDDTGRLWMRVGKNLVQALPLSEYRAVRK